LLTNRASRTPALIRWPHMIIYLDIWNLYYYNFTNLYIVLRLSFVRQKRSDRPLLLHGAHMEDPELEKVTVRLPERYVRALDFLVKVDDFPSRSEAIRAAIRDFIYQRVDVVMDKVKKMEEAEKTLAAMEQFESEYLMK
jgi:Arc/MetJ-type ribon-helix-helix transcriptional regulator